LLDRTALTVQKVLRESKRTWSDVTRLLLVGGSTRMPMIRDMLEQESGLTTDRSLAPDEAVAHGAAIYAGLLLGGGGSSYKGMSVTNVNSHDLGVLGIEQDTGLSRKKTIIPRNTPLPTFGTASFVTRKESQRSVSVRVIEGGDEAGRHASQIGKCVVADLPQGLPAGTRVKVTFNYAANGRLTVGAAIPGAGRHERTTIQRSSGLSEDMLADWQQQIEAGEFGVPFTADKPQSGKPEDADDEKLLGAPDAEAHAHEAEAASSQSVQPASDDQPDASTLDNLIVGDQRQEQEPANPADTALNNFLKGLGD
jgi:molecular chaperone DnaK